MKEKFPDLFDYNFHCNKELIKRFEEEFHLVPEKSLLLINHILNAHQVWNARILGQQPFHPWQMNEFNELASINQLNFLNTQKILSQSDLSTLISYKNSKGEAFENKFEDILFHVINHSTYHRGQIAMIFREAGIEPLVTDYIFYKR